MPRTIIVVPCYNEAGRLEVHEFLNFARDRHWVRVLFVDDGSTDETPAVLKTLQQSDPGQFAVCRLPENLGKAEAVRQGMLRALADDPELVGYWDADLATPLEAVDEFRDVLGRDPKLQIAMGARVALMGRRIERRMWRHYLGRIFATAASMVLRLPVYDTQCGAKLFRASPQLKRHFERPFHTNWIFDVELLARFIHDRRAERLSGIEEMLYEVPLRQWVDVSGSKVKARDFAKAAAELVRIYWTYMRRGASLPRPLKQAVPAPHINAWQCNGNRKRTLPAAPAR